MSCRPVQHFGWKKKKRLSKAPTCQTWSKREDIKRNITLVEVNATHISSMWEKVLKYLISNVIRYLKVIFCWWTYLSKSIYIEIYLHVCMDCIVWIHQFLAGTIIRIDILFCPPSCFWFSRLNADDINRWKMGYFGSNASNLQSN